jgi:D-glycero-D-manno-heptose 1,7-bisphosphate phosphatase
MGKTKVVFLDRDGTMNVDKGYVYKVEDFELIPGTIEALEILTENEIKIYIITNQAGIAKGYYTEEQFRELTKSMLKLFENRAIKIEKVLYCPHHPEGVLPEYSKECLCRKPNTKLLDDVIKEDKYQPNEIALIGDKNSDIEAGNRMGVATYLVLTGYGMEHQVNTAATYVKSDILSAVRHIVGRTNV